VPHQGRASDISLKDRFGVINKLELYSVEELGQIVKRSARILNVGIEDEAAEEIARRARGTPRVANRILKELGFCPGKIRRVYNKRDCQNRA